ncbi:MAG: ferritin family protein [Nitrospirota bacterium]
MNPIKLAIKTETDAIAFYKEAAEKTKHPIGKKMFLSIMGDEKRHLEDFKCILQGLDIKVRDVISPMKKIKTVFEENKKVLLERIRATTDEMEALKIAMQMEKESIELYKKLLEEVKAPKEKALFERLIKEEQEHFSIFSNTYFFLSDSGSWFMWEEHSIVDGGTPWA